MRFMSLRLVVALFVSTVMMMPVMAQSPDPSLSLIPKTYGPVGIYVPEAGMTTSEPLNPARQNSLLDLGQTNFTEMDGGQLNFRHGGGRINWLILNYGVVTTKHDSLRISYNHLSSGNLVLPITGGLPTSLHGESVELVAAHRTGPLDIGAAIVPLDTSGLRLEMMPGTKVTTSTTSRLQYRVGTTYRIGQVLAAAEAGEETGEYAFNLPGVFPAMCGKYAQRHATYGATYSPALGSTLFYNKQRIEIHAAGGSIVPALYTDYWGIEQALSKQVIVRLARSDTASSAAITVLGKEYTVTASYTSRAFSSTEQAFGRSDLLFVSVELVR